MEVNQTLFLGQDHFAKVFTEHPIARSLFIIFAIFTSVFGSLGLYSIIWFERFGSDHKRTILNMLSTLICWPAIEFLIFVETVEIIRFVIGPLPERLCFAQQVFRSRIFKDVIIQFDANIICRYICIFVLKNPAGLNDEFWSCFICFFIRSFNGIFQMSWHFLSVHQPIGYYICAGLNPTEALKHPLKTYAIWEMFSIILHICIHLRIYIHKNNSTSEGKFSSNDRNFEPRSFASFAINIVCIFFLISSTFIMLHLSHTSLEHLSRFPNYFFVYYRSLAVPGCACIIIVSMYFLRHSGLRNLVIESARSFLWMNK